MVQGRWWVSRASLDSVDQRSWGPAPHLCNSLTPELRWGFGRDAEFSFYPQTLYLFEQKLCISYFFANGLFIRWMVITLGEILSEWAMPEKEVLTYMSSFASSIQFTGCNCHIVLIAIDNWSASCSLTSISITRETIRSHIVHHTDMYLDHRMALKSERVVSRVHRGQTGGGDRGS